MKNTIGLQVGVKILLKNTADKYLLIHRSPEKYPDSAGRWDIVGGRVNAGDTLIENLKREVSEETGLEIIGAPRLIAAQDILRRPGFHVVRLTYLGEAKGEIQLDMSENDIYAWYTWEQMLALDDLDKYLKELLNDESLRACLI